MSCWYVLEQRSKAERDKAAEAVSEVRGRLQEQKALYERTQEIAEQYQKKILATQGSVTHFGDIQLYRNSLKQMQQAVGYIRRQIAALDLELSKRKHVFTQAEIQRQKYQKLIEREREQLGKLATKLEVRELDEIGGQRHYRKSKLA